MLTNSHILITGANGFVGRHLNKTLLAMGANVSQLVRSVSPLAIGTQYAIDLTNREKVTDVFALLKPDYVIHLAGSRSRANLMTQFSDIYETNLSMSLNVIDACRGVEDFKKLIFLGSCDEYGLAPTPYDEAQKEMPTSAYGLSKLTITQFLACLFRSQGFPSVVLRPTVIYGPGQGDEMFVSGLTQSLLAGRDFAMTMGEQRRDFIFINDVVDAVIKAVISDERVNGMVINIGAGVSYQIKEVATLVADLVGPSVSRLIKFGAVQYRFNEVMHYSVETSRARESLGWYPKTSLETGLLDTINHFKAVTANNTIAASKDYA